LPSVTARPSSPRRENCAWISEGAGNPVPGAPSSPAAAIAWIAAHRAIRRLRMRQNTNDRHHAVVLVSEDVAVIDEVADVGSAEVHTHLDARVGSGAAP